jgi:hypothetical protein
MTLADQAADFLAVRTWDATARQWVPRPAGAPVAFSPAPTTPPAVLFSGFYAPKVADLMGQLQAAGQSVDEAAGEVWARLAKQGWTPSELAVALGPYVDASGLLVLEARHEGLQNWGPLVSVDAINEHKEIAP